MRYIQTKNIQSYSPLLDGLYEDFGCHFYMSILRWCKLISIGQRRGDGTEVFWEIWIVKKDNETIGICGLYSLAPKSTETLWLGWFGVLPKYRNNNLGGEILNWLKKEGKKRGAKTLMSYVDQDGKPLQFYKRHGFRELGRVGDYVKENNLDMQDFESKDDFVIQLHLN